MVSPVRYIQEVSQELRKVTWPTAQQTQQMTLLVIAVSLAVALYVGILDFAFSELMKFLITR